MTYFASDLSQIESVVDWEVMRAQMWANTADDPDRRRRRMAEFLVHHQVPIECFSAIVVRHDTTRPGNWTSPGRHQLPTKAHWRSRSKLSDIKAGLTSLREVIQGRHIDSIAIPPLGCGNGGLDWSDVRPLIVEALGELPGVRVMVYPPQETPSAKSMPVRTRRPRMTAGRSALLAMLGSYVCLSQREEAATADGASLLATGIFLQRRGGGPVDPRRSRPRRLLTHGRMDAGHGPAPYSM